MNREYLLEENPWFGNPRRRRRRRNPLSNPKAMTTTMKEWTQGVDVMDMVSGVAGLAAASLLPAAIVKDELTTGKKILKIALAIGAAIGAGTLARSMISPSAGKAAVIGGLAGVGVQVLAVTTGYQITGPRGGARMLTSGRVRRIGETNIISPSMTREGETVSLIQP